MSSVENTSTDYMQFIYVGAIGLITLGIGAYIFLRNGDKQPEDNSDNGEKDSNKGEQLNKSEDKREKRKKNKKNKPKEEVKKEEYEKE